MRCGIVGPGKMGKEIEAMAARRGHDIVWRLGSRENAGASGLTRQLLSAADLVFEFTAPSAAVDNLLVLARSGAKVVCGTTGWTSRLPEIREAFSRGNGALVYAANFSVGVVNFLELARRAGRLYAPAGYAVYLVEEHHAEKQDSPSGTARALARALEESTGQAPPIASVRAGTIPGTHRLVLESPEDEVEMIHRARGRQGFARGAVWAGERITARVGVFEFSDLLKEVQEKEVS